MWIVPVSMVASCSTRWLNRRCQYIRSYMFIRRTYTATHVTRHTTHDSAQQQIDASYYSPRFCYFAPVVELFHRLITAQLKKMLILITKKCGYFAAIKLRETNTFRDQHVCVHADSIKLDCKHSSFANHNNNKKNYTNYSAFDFEIFVNFLR